MVKWRKSTASGATNCVEAASWRKSTRCASRECVEAASWRKSTASGPDHDCVEAGHGPGVVGVRDTQDRDGSLHEVTPAAWAAFTARLKALR